MSYTESKCPDCKTVVLIPRSRPELMLELGRKVVRVVPDMAAGQDVYQDTPNAFVVHECEGTKASTKVKKKPTEKTAPEE